jgi:hypothetical protein
MGGLYSPIEAFIFFFFPSRKLTLVILQDCIAKKSRCNKEEESAKKGRGRQIDAGQILRN